MTPGEPTGGNSGVTALRPWKGLDTSRKPVFLSYDQIERMVAALLPAAAKFQPAAVVGIARGGLVPAAMAAGILALPLAFLTHDRGTGAVTWIGTPAAGQRILLVDDCCSSGITLHRARAKLCDEGRECLTLVVVHDPDIAQFVPDLSHPMRELFRLPWERGEATPTGRAAKVSTSGHDFAAEAPFVALGLGLVPPMERALPLPPDGRGVLISALPASGRAGIEADLAATQYRDLPLECRPDNMADDKASIARFKADAATRWGCTHFLEGDAEQAIGIAANAPHLIVTWWSSAEQRGWIVSAAARRDSYLATAPENASPSRSPC